MNASFETDPTEFAAELARRGGRGALVLTASGEMQASAPWLAALAKAVGDDGRDFHDHEAVFLGTGPTTGALFGVFVHKTVRGQAAGGVRNWPFDTMDAFLRDGLRLAVGMSRKNALAGLWWGGGKAVIARPEPSKNADPKFRASVYREYGAFVSSLRGCYVTAEDVGTVPSDLAEVFGSTRFTTCIPPALGGSGNPSPATAKGVVCAMEGALDFLGRGGLRGKKVAMQGAGNVAAFMIDELLTRGVSAVVATEVDDARCRVLAGRWSEAVDIRHVARDDLTIFAESADVFAPNALGAVLGPETIGLLGSDLICGAANNQLVDDRRDDAALRDRGVTYVPDFVANRMGIVNCANEQYGRVPADPAIERHFGREWENSVYRVTKAVLARARDEGLTTSAAANALADEQAAIPHPIWGHRSRSIIDGLVADAWAGAC